MTTLCGPPVDVQGSGASHRNSEEGHRRGRLLLSYQHHFAACSCLGCQDNERPLLPGACEHSSELGQAGAADDTRRDLHLIVDLLLLDLLLLLLPDGVNAGLSTMSVVTAKQSKLSGCVPSLAVRDFPPLGSMGATRRTAARSLPAPARASYPQYTALSAHLPCTIHPRAIRSHFMPSPNFPRTAPHSHQLTEDQGPRTP